MELKISGQLQDCGNCTCTEETLSPPFITSISEPTNVARLVYRMPWVFTNWGHCALTLQVPFLCPLEGHIYLKMQCQVGSSRVEERGFLVSARPSGTPQILF